VWRTTGVPRRYPEQEGTTDFWRNFFGVSSGISQDEELKTVFEVLKQMLYI
jgi:hypothetical protein